MEKVCNRCGETKPIYDFGNNKSYKDGINSICKVCNKERGKEWRLQNPDKLKELKSKYRQKYKDQIKEKYKKYYQDRIEYFKIKNGSYRQKGINKERRNEYQRKRREENYLELISHRVRNRVGGYLKLKKINKNNTTFNIIGCSPEQLKIHLESKFSDGMSWDNRNEWHIDHIIPLSSAQDEKTLYELFHYTNLQPLWIMDNLKKGDKIL